MDEDNNERLAYVYDSHHTQVVVIYPNIWKHEPNGDWFVRHILELKL